MDEAEKCTNLAYIHMGNLLYTGSTSGIIPFSQIESLVSQSDRRMQADLANAIEHSYPRVMTSFINNQLRVSSRDGEILKQIALDFPNTKFESAVPTFEEVFVGLIS